MSPIGVTRAAALERLRRDTGNVNVLDDDQDGFWWSTTGNIVRWVFAGMTILIVFFLVVGYMHGKRRVRRGLAPFAYHRFLLSKSDRARHDPNYRHPQPDYLVYRQDQYGMHAYPPPVYDPNAPAPPSYQPPAEVSKIDPSQCSAGSTANQRAPEEPSPEYTPPPGSPHAAELHASDTGSCITNNNPYRQ